MKIITRITLIVAAMAAFTSCAGTKKNTNAKIGENFDPPAYRPKNPSAVRVKISTGKQRVYVVEGSRVLLATPCSVGTASTPTPAGNYRIYSKQATRRRQSSPGAGYPMAYWMEFKSAYGMHWGFVKPYPCTHGCVRLPMKSAAKIFAMVQNGTPINISSSQPEDAKEGAALPVLDDSSLPNPSDSYLQSAKFFQDAKYKGKMFID
jgi:lipoprotein-anchoring transpeptidase ErfK/SrfK